MSGQSRGAVDLLPWNNLDSLDRQPERNLRACSISAAAIPRCVPSDLSYNDIIRSGVCSSSLCPHGSSKASSSPASSSTEHSSPIEDPSFVFKAEPQHITFTFHRAPPQCPPGVAKRVRHRLDVDGPNTAGLCCKKRRLRGELITSRLSQPYSQPATHILNREGQKQGDKRFVKMASSLEMARRIAHLQTTSFLRFSVMNRLRQRLGLGPPGQHISHGDEDEDDKELGSEENLDTTSKAPWQPQSIQTASRGKYLRPSKDAAAIAGGSRLSKPAALPLPPADLFAARKRTSSRIHPVRSPELRPERAAYYEELDDDGFAYLHSEEDGACDDGGEPESVYSDFGVIFGGDSPASEGDHSYEEYLDELDGISWVTL